MKYIIKDYHYSNGKKLEDMNTYKEVHDWVLDGLRCCCGCERDPYVNVLIDLEYYTKKYGKDADKKVTLKYL